MTVVSPVERLVSSSPQAPTDRIATATAATIDEVVRAGERARAAQHAWWQAGAGTRSAALGRWAGLIAERAEEAVALCVREVGKPVAEARGEVSRAVSIAAYYAQQAVAPTGSVYPASLPGRLWSERRPHGVVGLVTPWNFPVAIPLWKAAPALAAGNAVLLKPSPDSFVTARWLGALADEVLPEGLVQVLPGGAATGQAVLAAADAVSFTGSETVGRQVVARVSAAGRPVQAEMGGQNAAIVLPDADAEQVAMMVAPAAMAFAGQKCTATRRVVVVGSAQRRREVRDALVAATASLVVGEPADVATTVGPLVSEAARDRVVEAASVAVAAGGRVLCGGTAPAREGWYAAPTLVDGLPADHLLATEELFGPFAVVLDAVDVPEAVRIAEQVRFGLVTSVHGRDTASLLEVVDGVGTGMVKVNAPTTGVDYYAPFGGEGDSSHGPREQGPAALDFYSSVRTVTFAPHA